MIKGTSKYIVKSNENLMDQTSNLKSKGFNCINPILYHLTPSLKLTMQRQETSRVYQTKKEKKEILNDINSKYYPQVKAYQALDCYKSNHENKSNQLIS